MAFGRRGLFYVLVTVVVACASPTLPLPPPEIPTMTNGSAAGTIHLSGANAEPGANVVALNDNAGPVDKGVVSGVRDNGTWDLDIIAKNGDVLTITQEFGKIVSIPLKLTVKVP